MSELILDHYGFLSKNLPQTGDKLFTLNAGGEIRSQADHTVIVWHKNSIKSVQRKDLGNTMMLLRFVPDTIELLNNDAIISEEFLDTMYSVCTRYNNYDEFSNTLYYYIPKHTGSNLLSIMNRMDIFTERNGFNIIDIKKGWFTLVQKKHKPTSNFIFAEFFALCLLFGKETIKNNILTSYKIQVPVLNYQIKENIQTIINRLRSHGIVIVMNHNTNTQIIDITTQDYMLLSYIRILLGKNNNSMIINKMIAIQEQISIHYAMPPMIQSLKGKLYEVKR